VQIVDDGAAAQIEEILANSSIVSASSLPPTNMGKRISTGILYVKDSPKRPWENRTHMDNEPTPSGVH